MFEQLRPAGTRWRVFLLLLVSACSPPESDTQTVTAEQAVLTQSQLGWVAARIFRNETGGDPDLLTYWGAGEDFPSLGIGHFIWFPSGVEAPFDESFPAMFEWVSAQQGECHRTPGWLAGLQPFDAPWSSKSEFDAALGEDRLVELRLWLQRTALLQAEFIVHSFESRWDRLELGDAEKQRLDHVMNGLLQTPQGTFAVIDYSNFKGMGTNPKERYQGSGWGLLQVLGDIAAQGEADEVEALPKLFGQAAANRLRLRVDNSPAERDEGRWLPGWVSRTESYYMELPPAEPVEESQFRSPPRIRTVGDSTARIDWSSNSPDPATLTLYESSDSNAPVRTTKSSPKVACALAYHVNELGHVDGAVTAPYEHSVSLQGLQAGLTYRFVVDQSGETAEGTITTTNPQAESIRFVVYADSEVEPESRGKHAEWTDGSGQGGTYPVDQLMAYQANLGAIVARKPDFVAIAGDLVESGGEQRDWQEFWRLNAVLASATPIVAAPGNHEYFGGPRVFGGYSAQASRRAIEKFKAYFGSDTYYSYRHGPIALIVLDVNNSQPERSDADTNWYLNNADNVLEVPNWRPGSAQWNWLESELRNAQRDAFFTFVMFHHPPYSSGVHGRVPGTDNARNFSSGVPLRELTPLLVRYGVDAVFNGHDEMYEHSMIEGTEMLGDGGESQHELHFFTVGIGGDGLRGSDGKADNPHRVFTAVVDDGEPHYGHVEVNLARLDDGRWEALIEPVYVVPVLNSENEDYTFERRIYDDVVLIQEAVRE